jgi:hypothetical protein
MQLPFFLLAMLVKKHHPSNLPWYSYVKDK